MPITWPALLVRNHSKRRRSSRTLFN